MRQSRKYNDALNLCREGHEDMAAIQAEEDSYPRIQS